MKETLTMTLSLIKDKKVAESPQALTFYTAGDPHDLNDVALAAGRVNA